MFANEKALIKMIVIDKVDFMTIMPDFYFVQTKVKEWSELRWNTKAVSCELVLLATVCVCVCVWECVCVTPK